MRINDLFARIARGLAVATIAVAALAMTHRDAAAQSFTTAPTPVYGSTESQSTVRYRGPGLPGAEAQQSVDSGSRHVLFDVAGYDGVIYSPVTPPNNSNAAYRTFAGQPTRGSDALLAQSLDGTP